MSNDNEIQVASAEAEAPAAKKKTARITVLDQFLSVRALVFGSHQTLVTTS